MAKLSEQFLQVLDDAASKKEVAELFQKLIDLVKNVQNTLENKDISNVEEMRRVVAEALENVKQTEQKLTSEVDNTRTVSASEVRTLTRMLQQEIERVELMMPTMPDMDAEHEMMEKRLSEVEAKIPTVPEQFDPSNIFTELTGLVERVEKLEERVEELAKRPVGTIGSGVSDMRIARAFKYILKTEEPVGDIDGVNLAYTVSQHIFAVLSFSLNGESIAQLPNYTISGRTITFASALPAAYSGKDFECKYIAA